MVQTLPRGLGRRRHLRWDGDKLRELGVGGEPLAERAAANEEPRSLAALVAVLLTVAIIAGCILADELVRARLL